MLHIDTPYCLLNNFIIPFAHRKSPINPQKIGRAWSLPYHFFRSIHLVDHMPQLHHFFPTEQINYLKKYNQLFFGDLLHMPAVEHTTLNHHEIRFKPPFEKWTSTYPLVLLQFCLAAGWLLPLFVQHYSPPLSSEAKSGRKRGESFKLPLPFFLSNLTNFSRPPCLLPLPYPPLAISLFISIYIIYTYKCMFYFTFQINY